MGGADTHTVMQNHCRRARSRTEDGQAIQQRGMYGWRRHMMRHRAKGASCRGAKLKTYSTTHACAVPHRVMETAARAYLASEGRSSRTLSPPAAASRNQYNQPIKLGCGPSVQAPPSNVRVLPSPTLSCCFRENQSCTGPHTCAPVVVRHG
jgi:hypothetical protein